MTLTTPDQVDHLRRQLDFAVAAASDAYRHSTQLIRVLSVLGQPASPEELAGQVLIVLSQAFGADVVVLGRLTGDRVVVSRAFGLPEDDPTFDTGWSPGAGVLAALRGGKVLQVPASSLVEGDLPSSLAGLGIESAAWVPLVDPGESQPEATGGGLELIALFRRSATALTPTDLQVLASAGARVRLAIETRARGVAIERLARSGHRLSHCVDMKELIGEATAVLPGVLDADEARIVLVGAEPGEDQAAFPGWRDILEGRGYCGIVRDPSVIGFSGTAARALIGVPVVGAEAPAAVLYATRDSRRPFHRDSTEIANIFATYLNAAMRNVDLYRALRSSEDELRERATHDPLTGLANRALLNQRLEHLLAGDGLGHVGLLFCDLDKFKEVNDRLGHEAGDDLLTEVANRLRARLRPVDLLARFGGDEFVILLAEVEGDAALRAVGRRVVDLMRAPFQLAGELVVISASVGGVLGLPGIHTASDMLRDADAAMYDAKRRGRARVAVFDDVASTDSRERLVLMSDIRSALGNNQLSLLYQPIADLVTGEITGFEALLRWTHPTRGAIEPSVFVPLAEETGAIVEIGAWALAEACGHLAEWQRIAGQEGLELSVNLSPTELCQPELVRQVLEVIVRSGVPAHSLWLELTERGPVDADMAGRLGQLRRAGVRFALDDFGIAHSNLDHLKHLPVDRIKIDRSFVESMTTHPMDRAIVRAVLAMADSLGLGVVAEAIESIDQHRILVSMGCTQGQGYLISHPLPAEDVSMLLGRHYRVLMHL